MPLAYEGDGTDILRASADTGMEGVVAKRRDSHYRPGRRSPDWRKIKHVRTQEVVIAGWRPRRGRRDGGIGSLILAVHGPDGLQHVGGVGTGFTERMLTDLAARLAPLATTRSPSPRRSPAPTPATPTGSAEAVIDFVGVDATLRAAVGAVRTYGSIVVVGLGGGTLPFTAAAPPASTAREGPGQGTSGPSSLNFEMTTLLDRGAAEQSVRRLPRRGVRRIAAAGRCPAGG